MLRPVMYANVVVLISYLCYFRCPDHIHRTDTGYDASPYTFVFSTTV